MGRVTAPGGGGSATGPIGTTGATGASNGSKGWIDGTHRAVPPEATWRAVEPLLTRAGVTRMAEITGLDRIGIPVWAAIRPRGRILQTTNGKGLRAVDARVSAAMEALEHAHCEGSPAEAPFRARAEEVGPGVVVPPGRLPLAIEEPSPPATHLPWVRAVELRTGERAWVPAGAAYPDVLPRVFAFSATGLASGNTTTEATLHALYEVVERDVVTRRVAAGLRLRPHAAERVVESSVAAPGPASLLARIREAGLRAALVLLRHPARLPVFWCALLDPRPFHPCTRVTFGYGAHLSPAVAAVRALSEAAQARLAYISAVREDFARKIERATEARVRPVFDYFDALEPTLRWDDVEDRSTDSLEGDLDGLLALTKGALGTGPVYRVEMSWEGIPLAVVKVLVEGAVVDRRFF